MSKFDDSFTPKSINTNDPQTPNSQIAANKDRTFSDSVYGTTGAREGRLHERVWFAYDIDERTQFRVTTVLAKGSRWRIDARDWFWKDGGWHAGAKGGCFRAPYGLDAARAVVRAGEALRQHGAPFDDGSAS